MDLMLSLSRHCSLEGGLAQRSAAGCVAGGFVGRTLEGGGGGGGDGRGGGGLVHQKTCTRAQT